MIRVTVDIVPFGDESLTRKIGEVLLVNDETGNGHTDNYCYAKDLGFKGNFVGHIDGHERNNGWAPLLARILADEGMPSAQIEVGTVYERLVGYLNSAPKPQKYIYNIGWNDWEESTYTQLTHSEPFSQAEVEKMTLECVVEVALAQRSFYSEHPTAWSPRYATLHESAMNLLVSKYGFQHVDFQADISFDNKLRLMDEFPRRVPCNAVTKALIEALQVKEAEAKEAK